MFKPQTGLASGCNSGIKDDRIKMNKLRINKDLLRPAETSVTGLIVHMQQRAFVDMELSKENSCQ